MAADGAAATEGCAAADEEAVDWADRAIAAIVSSRPPLMELMGLSPTRFKLSSLSSAVAAPAAEPMELMGLSPTRFKLSSLSSAVAAPAAEPNRQTIESCARKGLAQGRGVITKTNSSRNGYGGRAP